MKVSRILCIIGLCICVPLFVFLLVFPKCSNINTASAYEVEDNTLGYVSTILDGGYFYFDNSSFDDSYDEVSTDTDNTSLDFYRFQPSYRTMLPSSLSFDPSGSPSSISTDDGISVNYFSSGLTGYPFDDCYGFTVLSQRFLPNDSSINPYLYFTNTRYYSYDTLLSALRHFEIGSRSNTTVNYKLDLTINNISSLHSVDGVPTSNSLHITTDFLKYISLKDYFRWLDLATFFDYDYNNTDNTYNTNVSLVSINFTLYMYDPVGNDYSFVDFSSSIESLNSYNSFVYNNANEIFNYTVINNPSPVNIIFDGVYSFFMLEVFPSFYLYYIVAIALGGVMVGMVLKLFLGG